MHECGVWNDISYLHETLLRMSENSASTLVNLLNSLLLSSNRFEAAAVMAAWYFLSNIEDIESASSQFLSSKVSRLLHSKFPHKAALSIEECFGMPGNIVALANRIRFARTHCKRQTRESGEHLWNEVVSTMESYFREYLTNPSAGKIVNLQRCDRTIILTIDTLFVMAKKRCLSSHDEHVTAFKRLSREVHNLITSPRDISEIPAMTDRFNSLQNKILSFP